MISSSPVSRWRISSRSTVCAGAFVPAGISPRQAHSSLLPVRGAAYETKRAPWISWVSASEQRTMGMAASRAIMVKRLD
ncbi:hypothetical protein AUW26_03605 [Streptomyces sp. CC71]|nr:hypothetical protein AUW26_03605 [Streptomyces sp. CC71]